MSERFSAARGRKVVSRSSAEELGTVSHLVIDAPLRAVSMLVVGKRRGARIVAWKELSGFGADAVMLLADEGLHEPSDERERDAVKGRLEVLNKRVLSELGNDLGNVEDVVFDTDTGTIESIIMGGVEYPGDTMMGLGSYALILRAP
jgi:uncharacterized protein YrrD